MLPDNVLLEIFDFYGDDPESKIAILFSNTWRWDTLTQVCRRWRQVIFESPRRLDLRLICSDTTPTSSSLDIWPPLPITVMRLSSHPQMGEGGVENIIAAIERRNRISEVYISNIHGSTLETLITAMHEPLPILTDFFFTSNDKSAPMLPKTFLGGSAPCLRTFVLKGIPFPTFPKFVLSATYINSLKLFDIPHSGHISPEVMVTSLAALPNLKYLSFGFRSPLSRPSPSQTTPPLTRTVLPTLIRLSFSGVSEYLEDFLARIHTPLLNQFVVVFFMDLIFDIPQLYDFVHRMKRSQPFNQASIEFSGQTIRASLGSQNQLELEIRCERPDWQLSSIAQVFSQQLALLSHVEQLELRESPWEHTEWKDDSEMDSLLWLELFHLFMAVQSLYVTELLVPPVTAALKELAGERAMEVLPALRHIFLEGLQPAGFVQEAMKPFVADRQDFGHPVVIQRWKR